MSMHVFMWLGYWIASSIFSGYGCSTASCYVQAAAQTEKLVQQMNIQKGIMTNLIWNWLFVPRWSRSWARHPTSRAKHSRSVKIFCIWPCCNTVGTYWMIYCYTFVYEYTITRSLWSSVSFLLCFTKS